MTPSRSRMRPRRPPVVVPMIKPYLTISGHASNTDASDVTGRLATPLKGRAMKELLNYAKDARAAGESEQRLYALPAWREAPFYSRRERAALAWTEAVTRLAGGPVPEALYGELREQFNEKEAVDLTMAIIAINGWNRLAATFRSPTPGTYQPPQK